MTVNKIHVYGLGAVGSNLLVQLAIAKPEIEFSGFDFDKVEPRNIPTQAYFLEHVEKPKAAMMAAVLQRKVRGVKYKPVNGKVARPLQDVPADTLVLDCFDNTASRRLLTGARGNILHVGFSPFYAAECQWSPSYVAPEAVPDDAPDLCTLPDAVAFILGVVSDAAKVAIRFLNTGEQHNFIVTPTKTPLQQVRLL